MTLRNCPLLSFLTLHAAPSDPICSPLPLAGTHRSFAGSLRYRVAFPPAVLGSLHRRGTLVLLHSNAGEPARLPPGEQRWPKAAAAAQTGGGVPGAATPGRWDVLLHLSAEPAARAGTRTGTRRGRREACRLAHRRTSVLSTARGADARRAPCVSRGPRRRDLRAVPRPDGKGEEA
jgi:hypothetical protein